MKPSTHLWTLYNFLIDYLNSNLQFSVVWIVLSLSFSIKEMLEKKLYFKENTQHIRWVFRTHNPFHWRLELVRWMLQVCGEHTYVNVVCFDNVIYVGNYIETPTSIRMLTALMLNLFHSFRSFISSTEHEPRCKTKKAEMNVSVENKNPFNMRENKIANTYLTILTWW